MQTKIVDFKINGISFKYPVNMRELQIMATYEDDAVEATLEIEALDLANEAAGYIKAEIEKGKTGVGPGIFQGLPFSIILSNGTNTLDFNGYLDLTTTHIIHPSLVRVKAVRIDIDDVIERLQSITYGLLKEQGNIGGGDYTAVQYVVEKEFNQAEFAILAITTYLMAKETAEQARKVANSIATVAGIAAAGVTGSVGALIYAIATLAIDIAYAVGLTIALIKLLREVIEQVYPPVRTHQGITFRKALEKAFGYFDYAFTSPIADLDWVYVPSKPDGARLNEGIPNPADYGYRCSDMLALCKQMFNARLRVDAATRTVQMRSLNDPYWKQSTSYVMRDHLDEEVDYNAADVVQTRLITFTIDQTDFWTVQNYKGTSYEINTIQPTPPKPDYKTIKGLDEIRFPAALGSRKDGYTDVEKALIAAAKTIDAVLSVFGTSSGLTTKIQNRAGLLRQGTRYHSIPKIILWEGGKIPANHRDRLSAKYLYLTYINQKSLIANNYAEQKRVYKDRRRVLTLDSFMEARKNKYFATANGTPAEFTNIKWAWDEDVAVVDYKVKEKYSGAIEEKEYEQS